MTDKITEYKDQFPAETQAWIEKRLNQYNDRNNGLPSNSEINNVRDWVHGMKETHPDFIENKLNKVSWNDAVVLQDKWHKTLEKKAEKLSEFGGRPDGR